MRRFTAITSLLLMLAAFLAPVALATATNPLPACCRAEGQHHCSVTAASMVTGEVRVRGQSCPHLKPVACTGCVAPPPMAETVALATAHPFPNEFQAEFFVSHRELPYSQRAPPLAPSVN